MYGLGEAEIDDCVHSKTSERQQQISRLASCVILSNHFDEMIELLLLVLSEGWIRMVVHFVSRGLGYSRSLSERTWAEEHPFEASTPHT